MTVILIEHYHYVIQKTLLKSHGSKLLKLCQSAGLFIVNGRSQSDSTGSYTFNKSRGVSVIDYCVVSKDVWYNVCNFYDDTFNEFSDHAPIILMVHARHLVNDEPCINNSDPVSHVKVT